MTAILPPSPEEIASLRRIRAAALALALSDPAMRLALDGGEPCDLHDPWPEADALVAALLAGGARP